MTDLVLRLDWETRSDVNLKTEGIYRYVESPHTDALLASYKFGAGPLQRWRRGEPCPADIAAHVVTGGPIHAHNAAFERLIWWHIMSARHGWPRPALEQFRCTAVVAAAQSLPRSLDKLGEALDLAVRKDKRGTQLINRYSKPAGWTEDAAGRRVPIWREDEAGLTEFHDYCDQDVLTEEAAEARLIPLSDAEWTVYHLNERINDRGIRIDVESVEAAIVLAERAKRRLDREMTIATGGVVTACTKVADLKTWIEGQGVETDALGKADVEELLEQDDLPGHVRHALELRVEAAKTSVSKLKTLRSRVSADGRLRGAYLAHGAGQTGRFSSKGVQLHNLPRPRKEFETAKPRLSTLFRAFRTGDPAVIEWLYEQPLGRPLHLISDAIRGFMWAAPGHEFVNADYGSIEGRMSAWFARETWKLQAFEAFDRKEGPGMYELTASRIYDVAVEDVDKSRRAVGKVAELALGYNGGVGALSKMARDNKLKLHTVYGPVWESAPAERREQALERYEERVEKHDERAAALGREGWLTAELIKIGWRAAHPKICAAWRDLEGAAVSAVMNPGTVQTALEGDVRYLVRKNFLWCLLPSGRALAYGLPRMADVEAPWADRTLPTAAREKKRTLTALGVDSQTHRWTRFPLYGGAFFNNVVQGSARDILVHGALRAEAAGYPLVMHTHDELMAELPRGTADVAAFEALLCELPAWAEGLPLVASGWRGKRYRKD